MPEFFIGRLPDILYHGGFCPMDAGTICVPASENRWWREIDWDEYYEGSEGEDRTAYANVIWEHLGLCDPERASVPEWARDIRDMHELGQRIGILFVTDDPRIAESRYGSVHEIDMTSPHILDVVPDPNPGTYKAWALLLKPGEPLPIASPGPKP